MNLIELKNEQQEIAKAVDLTNHLPPTIKLVAGVDISSTRFSKVGFASLVLLTYPQCEILESICVQERLPIPYIPGYLAFREWPLIAACIQQLDEIPDVLICDGQGFAHPRRAGLACHVGVKTGFITIGCAKSRLIGKYSEPGTEKGATSDLIQDQQKIGEVVRTRAGIKPLFISPGHKIDFANASAFILSLCPTFRQPTPIRLAHTHVNQYRKMQEQTGL
jgi:deoxyribonuclease V